MSKDWTGNKKSTFSTLGASNHSDNDREINDFYATDPKALELLLKLESFNNVWECALNKSMKRTPIKVKTHANCRYSECGKEFRKFKTTDKYCCREHEIADKGFPEKKKSKPIPKVSDKRKALNEQYSILRKEFLSKPENRICPVTKKPTTEVHHKAGRVGFADEWARLNNIPLLIDVRYFLGVSRNGHRWIEENPIEAKKLGYSVDRLTLK